MRIIFIIAMAIAIAYLIWAAVDPAGAAKIFGS